MFVSFAETGHVGRKKASMLDFARTFNSQSKRAFYLLEPLTNLAITRPMT